jgi:aryl-alcohol dehydrogenase-like predicted oxidoreductase
MFRDENLKLVEKLIDFAQRREHTLLDLAFAWLLAHRPVASVIAGARQARTGVRQRQCCRMEVERR